MEEITVEYVVYWFMYESIKNKKKLTHREFDTLEEAERFANERLADCPHKIRRVEF